MSHCSDGRWIVVGVGNRDRGDDAVGPVVCDRIRGLEPGIEVWIVEADPSTLAVRWRADDHVVVIDAAVDGRSTPGTLHEIDARRSAPDGLAVHRPTSTHGIGIGDTILLADALRTRPHDLWVLGVEARSFDHGAPLTEAVAAAVDHVAARALVLLAGGVARRSEWDRG